MSAYVFSPEFQHSILRVMANDPTFLLGYRKAIAADYFTSPEDEVIAESILHIFDEVGNRPTLGSVLTVLEDVVPAALDIEAIAESAREIFTDGLPTDAAFVRERVKSFGQEQRLSAVMLRSQEFLSAGQYAEYEAAVRDAIQVSADSDDAVYDYMDEMEARLRQSARHANTTIPTGITSVDAHLPDGGLGRGEMGIVIGLPGQGKTTTLVNMGVGGLRAGYRVFHATVGDLNERKAAQRYDSCITGRHIAECRMYSAQAVHQVADWLETTGGANRLKLKYWPAKRVTVPEIENYIRWLEARSGWLPDLIVVDYGQKIRPVNKVSAEGRRHADEEIYEALRSMAGVFNAALWTAQQANRGQFRNEGAPPSMEEAAEAFGPMRDADVVLGAGQSTEMRNSGLINIGGAKVRDCEAEWVETLACDYSIHRIWTPANTDDSLETQRRDATGQDEFNDD